MMIKAEEGWKTRRNLGTGHRKLLENGNANAQGKWECKMHKRKEKWQTEQMEIW